jgi:nitrate reductase gamma subunit
VNNFYVNQFLFGIYPYLALAVFLAGSLIRFDREQYTWRAGSSQLLRRGSLRWGSNLFHVGILGIFFGHLVGLLTPMGVWHELGISASAKQLLAIVAGGIFGLMCVTGMALLLLRRIGDARVRSTTVTMDWVVLALLLAQVILGLISIRTSWLHRDGSEMVKFMEWAQRIVTFRGGAAELVYDAALVFKLHLVIGMTIFLVFPFSRLVHIWSGFGSVGYLFRPRQIVRARGR